jgi:hypothetical protein
VAKFRYHLLRFYCNSSVFLRIHISAWNISIRKKILLIYRSFASFHLNPIPRCVQRYYWPHVLFTPCTEQQYRSMPVTSMAVYNTVSRNMGSVLFVFITNSVNNWSLLCKQTSD